MICFLVSRNYSPSLKMNSNEDIDFNPSKINVFLDIAEYDIIPKLTKYINLNGGVQIEIYDYVFNH
jgi:hypothetical protein